MRENYYFCLNLTSGEHEIVEWDMLKYCQNNNLTLVYYRQLKDGHVPMYREVKVYGFIPDIMRFKTWMDTKGYSDHIEHNPYKVKTE